MLGYFLLEIDST